MYITARRTATEGFIELSRQTPALRHYTKKLFISIRISLRCSGSRRRPPRQPSAAGRNGQTVALPASPVTPPPRPRARARRRRIPPARAGARRRSPAAPCSTPWRGPPLCLPPLPLQEMRAQRWSRRHPQLARRPHIQRVTAAVTTRRPARARRRATATPAVDGIACMT